MVRPDRSGGRPSSGEERSAAAGGIPRRGGQPAPAARRRVSRLSRPACRARGGEREQRPRVRGGAASRRVARRTRSGEDGVLLEREPRVSHAAGADARPGRGAADARRGGAGAEGGGGAVARQPQRRAPPAAGEHAARFLPHRGGAHPRRVPGHRPGGVHDRAGERLPLRLRARRIAADGELPAAGRAGVRGPRDVGEDRPQPAVERLQVHLRRRDCGHAARSGRASWSWRCATPGWESPPRRCLGSSSASTASRTPAHAPTRGAGSGSHWCRNWCGCTEGAWPRRACREKGRPSPSVSR